MKHLHRLPAFLSSLCLPLLVSSSACGTQDATLADASVSESYEALTNGQAYILKSENSGMLMDVSGGVGNNGAKVVQQSATGGTSQQWRLRPSAQGAYEIINVNSGKCLDVTGVSKSEGVALQQYDCNGNGAQANQIWWFNQQSDGSYEIVSVNSGLVIDVAGISKSAGATVQQWPTWHGPNEKWILQPAGNTPVASTPVASTPVASTPVASAPVSSTPTTTAPNDQASLVRTYMKTILDTPHQNATGETRGYPGAYEALPSAAVDEYVASTIDCANRYLPGSLTFAQKVALILVDINAESAFNPATTAGNGQYGSSVGPQQVTPSIWVPMFAKHASGSNLAFYNGSVWSPAATTNAEAATSIWDNMHIANWAISVMAQNGGQDPNVGPGGPMRRTWWTGLYCWVSGYPAAQAGGDVQQSSHYRAMQQADLQLLGFSPGLLDTSF